jgi:hypothetical protein
VCGGSLLLASISCTVFVLGLFANLGELGCTGDRSKEVLSSRALGAAWCSPSRMVRKQIRHQVEVSCRTAPEAGDNGLAKMTKVLDPFRFVLIAVAGWMNQRQLQMIDYLREENRVLREQLAGRRLRLNVPMPNDSSAASRNPAWIA